MSCCEYNAELNECNLPKPNPDKTSVTYTNFITISTTDNANIPINIPTNNPINIPTNIPTNITTIVDTKINTIPTEIPGTIPKEISATIPETIQTEIPTTIYSVINTTFPLNIHTTIPPEISKTIQTIIPSDISTANPIKNLTTILTSSQTLIPTIIYNISSIILHSSTILNNITENITTFQTTEITLPNTSISISSELINEKDLLIKETTTFVFLGFSHFKKSENYFSFYTYLSAINNYIYSQLFNFPVEITYNANMRLTNEIEVNCTLHNLISSLKYQYLCEVYGNTINIKKISVKPDFKFFLQDNLEMIGISPLAHIYMNNLLIYDEKYDLISKSTIYLMNNSRYDIYDELLFNITGVINGTQPKLENKLRLMINHLSGQNIEVDEVDCTFNKIGIDSYRLNCKANKTIESDLQSAISIIDQGILLINFKNRTDTIIKLEKQNSYQSLFLNEKSGLKPGVIVALIIALFVSLSSIIFIFIYFRKRNKKKQNKSPDNSSIIPIKNWTK